MNNKMNDFVGNIVQNTFYACCYIFLSQVHALNADAHTPICDAAIALGATGAEIAVVKCILR